MIDVWNTKRYDDFCKLTQINYNSANTKSNQSQIVFAVLFLNVLCNVKYLTFHASRAHDTCTSWSKTHGGQTHTHTCTHSRAAKMLLTFVHLGAVKKCTWIINENFAYPPIIFHSLRFESVRVCVCTNPLILFGSFVVNKRQKSDGLFWFVIFFLCGVFVYNFWQYSNEIFAIVK